jgi:hypothetical protein
VPGSTFATTTALVYPAFVAGYPTWGIIIGLGWS